MDRSIAMDDSSLVQMAELRQALARGDSMLSGIAPILGHLLSATDHSLFSDEVVARVRGMLADMARQVLSAQAETTGERGRDSFVDRHLQALTDHFQASTALLLHCHALAIEWQLAERLEGEAGLDPVMSPLMQRLIASGDPDKSGAGMAALAAQARFAQAQRRMECPIGQLPGDLFHEALVAWRSYCGAQQSEALVRAEAKLRQAYDESGVREVLLARIVALAQSGSDMDALSIEDAGTGLFFSALATLSGQARDLAVLSSHPNQSARLVLGLRAAGLTAGKIDEILLRLHPGAAPLAGLDAIEPDAARALLTDSAHGLERR